MNGLLLPVVALVVGCGFALGWGGPEAALVTGMLAVMEVSLSFDNAVVNASVLRTMSAKWQARFLTWGILIAVFGMRLVFPVLIVSLASGLGMVDVAHMALDAPDAYASHLLDAHTAIASFGGMFLLMVFLHFVCDEAKDTHWIGWAERKLAVLGRMEAVQVAIGMGLLIGVQPLLADAERLTSAISGMLGIVTYVAIKGIVGLFGVEDGTSVAKAGLAGFIYLEILDASFSFDGVIGAFAISRDVLVIMIGLGVGALCVRSLTVHMVNKGTLDEFVYLEHGAHWGIGALAVIMLAGLVFHVPEVITGLIGMGFILASLASSVRHNRALVRGA